MLRHPIALCAAVAFSIAPSIGAQVVVGSAPGAPAPGGSPGSGGSRRAPIGPAALARVSGPSATQLQVTTVHPQTGVESAPALSGLTLVDLEVAGRTALSPVGHGGGRVVAGALANAVQLPGPDATRVFQYRRTGTPTFGLFAASGAGDVTILIERAGVGPGNALSPFHPAIGVSPDGHTIAVAAADYSGGVGGLGDTWLIRVDGQPLAGAAGPVVELTGAGEQEVGGTSLLFVGPWLFAVEDVSLVRAPADGSGAFAPIALGLPAGHEVVEEVLPSPDGGALFFLAGIDEDTVDLYRYELGGAVVNVTNAPGAIQPPGYLPNALDGPHLTVSADGAIVAYDRELANGHELYLQVIEPQLGAPIHVTPDANFEHSIDNVSGLLTGSAKFRFFMDSGLNNADLYEASILPGGGLGLKNLTQTSGASTPFFPNLATLNVNAACALGDARLVVDDRTAVGAGYDLWAITDSGASGVLAASTPTPPEITSSPELPGAALALAEGPTGDRLFVMTAATLPQELLATPPSIDLSSSALSPDGLVAVAVAAVGGQSYLARIAVPSGAFLPGPAIPFPSIDRLQFRGPGELLFTSTGAAGAETWRMDVATGAAKPLGAPAQVAEWLR